MMMAKRLMHYTVLIFKLSRNSHAVWHFVAVHGGIVETVKAMKRHRNSPKFLESGTCLLRDLLFRYPQQLSLVVPTCGVVTVVIGALKRFLMESCLQRRYFPFFTQIYEYIVSHPDMEELFQRLIPLVAKVVATQHEDNFLDPLLVGAKLFWCISSTNQGREQIVAGGGVEAVCRAIVNVNNSNYKQGLVALRLRILTHHGNEPQQMDENFCSI